jgi:hypothetical protein
MGEIDSNAFIHQDEGQLEIHKARSTVWVIPRAPGYQARCGASSTTLTELMRTSSRGRDYPIVWCEPYPFSTSITLTPTQLINKVAGIYGLVTLFVGGSFLQLSFYAYSCATLVAYIWALRIVKSVRLVCLAQLTCRNQPRRLCSLRTCTR